MADQLSDTPEPIDWHAVAARQHRHNLSLIFTALGDVGHLDSEEQRFISQVAWDGGHLQLASLLQKARQAPPAAVAPSPRDTAVSNPRSSEETLNPAAEQPAANGSPPQDAAGTFNDHVNDLGDWCPWSLSPVADDYPYPDERCPQACRASHITDEEE